LGTRDLTDEVIHKSTASKLSSWRLSRQAAQANLTNAVADTINLLRSATTNQADVRSLKNSEHDLKKGELWSALNALDTATATFTNIQSSPTNNGNNATLQGLAEASRRIAIAHQSANTLQTSDKQQQRLKGLQSDLSKLLQQLKPKLSSARFGRAAFAFPATEMPDIFGAADLVVLAKKIHDDLVGTNNTPVSTLQMQDYLIKNLDFAYGVLRNQCGSTTYRWSEFRNLSCAITRLALPSIEAAHQKLTAMSTNGPEADTVVPLSRWPLVVESALLASHLNIQIKDALKQEICLDSDPLLLRPTSREEEIFNRYVEKQWPMHVFALDPVTQDQNVADAASIRRNLRVALSFALATGKINGSQFLNYSKQFSLDLDAIFLNRTVSAFAQGSSTFGWRFFPRFSTKGKTKDRQIECGPRECTALVVIPAVVSSIEL
jgi:hypothetical protein